MRQFYETCRADPEVVPLVRQLPWSHNWAILSSFRRPEECELHLRTIAQGQWSSLDLERHLDGALFERAVLNPPRVSTLLRQMHPAAEIVVPDSRLVEFLG